MNIAPLTGTYHGPDIAAILPYELRVHATHGCGMHPVFHAMLGNVDEEESDFDRVEDQPERSREPRDYETLTKLSGNLRDMAEMLGKARNGHARELRLGPVAVIRLASLRFTVAEIAHRRSTIPAGPWPRSLGISRPLLRMT